MCMTSILLCICVFMYNVVYKRINKTLVVIHALSICSTNVSKYPSFIIHVTRVILLCKKYHVFSNKLFENKTESKIDYAYFFKKSCIL